MSEKRPYLARDAAEQLAIDALAYLATQPEALSQFLALSGIGPTTLRTAAMEPRFLGSVLDHFLGNETLLVDFASTAGIAPETIGRARQTLES